MITIPVSAPADAFRKLHPRTMATNPVMFVVLVGSVLTTVLFAKDATSATAQANVFAGVTALFLWFTVLFANFAEAVAEGRGKAQADSLRKTRSETTARRVTTAGGTEEVPSSILDRDDALTAGFKPEIYETLF